MRRRILFPDTATGFVIVGLMVCMLGQLCSLGTMRGVQPLIRMLGMVELGRFSKSGMAEMAKPLEPVVIFHAKSIRLMRGHGF